MEIVVPPKTNAERPMTDAPKATLSTIAKTTPSVAATMVTATKSSLLARLLRDHALRSLSFDTYGRSHIQFSRLNGDRSRTWHAPTPTSPA